MSNLNPTSLGRAIQSASDFSETLPKQPGLPESSKKELPPLRRRGAPVRQSKPKVRTGCLTCKKRKVKCDETKPECLRCLNLKNTKCEGYEVPKAWIFQSGLPESTRKTLALRPQSSKSAQSLDNEDDDTPHLTDIIPRSPSFLQGPDIESRSFNYYTTVTAEVIGNRSDRYYWTVLTPQAGVVYMPVKHAILALAMIAESANIKPSVQACKPTAGNPGSTILELTPTQADRKATLLQTAYKQYSLAINSLMSETDPSIEEILITCATLYTFENWTGSIDKAGRHMRGAIKLIRDWKTERQRLQQRRLQPPTTEDANGPNLTKSEREQQNPSSEKSDTTGVPRTTDEETMRRYIVPMLEAGMKWHELWMRHNVHPQGNFVPEPPDPE